MLQLPQAASSGPILDIAVSPTSNSVAVIGVDHSITIFSVPSGWERDDPPCDVIAHLPPGSASELGENAGFGLVNRVEWVRKDGGEWLAIGGRDGVIVVKPGDLSDQPGLNVFSLARDSKVLKTEGVSAVLYQIQI